MWWKIIIDSIRCYPFMTQIYFDSINRTILQCQKIAFNRFLSETLISRKITIETFLAVMTNALWCLFLIFSNDLKSAGAGRISYSVFPFNSLSTLDGCLWMALLCIVVYAIVKRESDLKPNGNAMLLLVVPLSIINLLCSLNHMRWVVEKLNEFEI